MKITRLYTGSDQKSHFEEIELKFSGDQPMLTTDARAASSAVFRSASAGHCFSNAIRRRAANILVTHVRRLGNRSQQRR